MSEEEYEEDFEQKPKQANRKSLRVKNQLNLSNDSIEEYIGDFED